MTDETSDRMAASDGVLAAAAAGGDRLAFDALVGRHQRRATQLAYRLLGNMDDALEVTQESFLRAYRRLASLSAPEKFQGWLLRIVSNQALNFRRGRALRKLSSLDAPGGGEQEDGRGELNLPDPAAQAPPQEASAKELERQIQSALAELPEKQRLALVMFSVQKMPQKEVAEALDISVEAVKWHVFTARKKLKDKLKDYL
jgi:RNA polymerase sigma-70 factor (ECF subfamily)